MRFTWLKATLLILAIAIALGVTPVYAHQHHVSFVTVDMPGATATAVTGINSHGVLCGVYRDASGGHHGWIRSGTTTTTFDYPGTNGVTFISGINGSGTVAGIYFDAAGAVHGFVRSSNGVYSAIEHPQAGTANGQGTFPVNITNAGVVSGWYVNSHDVAIGFVYAHGAFTTVIAPGAGTTAGQGTFPSGTNRKGAIVGSFTPADNVNYGFITLRGNFVTIIAPGAGTAAGQGTIPVSIADTGLVAGQTIDAGNANHGWIMRDGRFTPIDDPLAGTAAFQGTLPLNGSADGDLVVGVYFDRDSKGHGFMVEID